VKNILSLSVLSLLLLVSLVVLPAPAATVTCPSSCSCLLPAKAEELGYSVYCGGKQAVCGYDAAKNEKYCYTIPVTCPSSCSCYTLEDGKMKGYPHCEDTLTLCGYGANQVPMYCHQVPVTCPSTCTCQETKKYLEAGYQYCGGKQTVCGEDSLGNPLSCFEKPVSEKPVSCAKGCSCLDAAREYAPGYRYCGGTKTLCGYDGSKNPLYCFEKLVIREPVQVPQACTSGCSCYSLEEGTQQGLSLYEGKQTLCGYDTQQTPLYCFITSTAAEPAAEPASPPQRGERVEEELNIGEHPPGICHLSGTISNFNYNPESLKIKVQEIEILGIGPTGGSGYIAHGEPDLVPVTLVESPDILLDYPYSAHVYCARTYLVTPEYSGAGDECEWHGTWSPPSRTVEMEGVSSTGNDFSFTPRSLRVPIIEFYPTPDEPRINDPVTVTIRIHALEDVSRVRTKIDYTLTDGSRETGTWLIHRSIEEDAEGDHVTVPIPRGKDATLATIIAKVCDAAGNEGYGDFVLGFGSCTDGIQSGGEEDVDCGGPCHDCDVVILQGRILYEEMNSTGLGSRGFKPARLTHFRIREDDGDDDPYDDENVGGLRLTGEAGGFFFGMSRDGHVGDSLYLQIGGCHDLSEGLNYAAAVARDMEGCYQYPRWRSDEFLIPETGDVNLGDLRIGNDRDYEFTGIVEDRGWMSDLCGEHDPLGVICTHDDIPTPGGSVYFSIADALLTARRYADSRRDSGEDDSIGMEYVEYPESIDVSYHDLESSIRSRIRLSDEDGFRDGTVIHEFGHHLMMKISKMAGSGAYHELCTSIDRRFAWNEGFPEYLGTIIPYHNPYDPVSPSDRYLEGRNVAYSTIEDPLGACSPNPVNETVEVAVAGVLWDLVDDPATFTASNNEVFDNLLGYEDQIFAIFDSDLDVRFSSIGSTSPNICDFIDAFRTRSGASDADIDDILDEYDANC